MPLSTRLLTAWLVSAFAFALAFAAFSYITMKIENSPPPSSGFFRIGVFAFGLGLAVQLVYGGLVYLILTQLRLFNLPIVLLAYLAPVIVFSWRASDTTNDIVETIPWAVFAVILGFLSWFFAASPPGSAKL